MKNCYINLKRPKICFVSLGAYPVLIGKDLGFGGGAERKLTILAKEFVAQGFNVSFVTSGEHGKADEYINNIKIIKVYEREISPKLSFLNKAWQIWSALKKAGADIYIQSPALTAIVPLYCILKRKKSILCLSSDRSVARIKGLKNNLAILTLNHKLLVKMSHEIVAQNDFQKRMLETNFHKKSRVIKNPFQFSININPESKSLFPTIIWVAMIKAIKQPELFLQLAQAIPEAKFQMIGGVSDGEKQLFDSIQNLARNIPNLKMIGFVPYDKIDLYYNKANILVNTSKSEGFPNTFLEAWAAYNPVVSLNVDPDEIICRFHLGFHSKTKNQMVMDVQELIHNHELRNNMGKKGRLYVEKEHDINRVSQQYVELF